VKDAKEQAENEETARRFAANSAMLSRSRILMSYKNGD
jgi:hypothetical protein